MKPEVIETFPASMSDQEVFNTVAKHLFEQGERAVAIEGCGCQYRIRNQDGSFAPKRCAIGRCFPDSEYQNSYEGNGIRGLLDRHPKMGKRFAGNNKDLLSSLQRVHDFSKYNSECDGVPYAWESTGNMRAALAKVAEEHKLDSSILGALSFSNR